MKPERKAYPLRVACSINLSVGMPSAEAMFSMAGKSSSGGEPSLSRRNLSSGIRDRVDFALGLHSSLGPREKYAPFFTRGAIISLPPLKAWQRKR